MRYPAVRQTIVTDAAQIYIRASLDACRHQHVLHSVKRFRHFSCNLSKNYKFFMFLRFVGASDSRCLRHYARYKLDYYFAPDRGAKYCHQRVCMFVCLSLCLLAYLKICTSKFHQISCTRYLSPWIGPRLTATQYVTYFRFCGWRDVFKPNIDPNLKRHVCFVQFVRWQHRGEVRLSCYYSLFRQRTANATVGISK